MLCNVEVVEQNTYFSVSINEMMKLPIFFKKYISNVCTAHRVQPASRGSREKYV